MLPKALRPTALTLAIATMAGCGGGDNGTQVLAGSKAVLLPPGHVAAPAPAPAPAPVPAPPPAQPPASGGPPAISSFGTAASGVSVDLTGGSIAVAGDGSAWFTAGVGTGHIGRMTATGALSYPVTTDAADGSYGTGPLAAGPDGEIWFADPVGGINFAGAIGRIDTATGHATKFATPLLRTTTQFTQSTSQDQSCTSGICTSVAPGSCAPSPPQPASAPPAPLITCQTLTTGPTPVPACAPISAAAGNAWTTTTCATNSTGPTAVQVCAPILASSINAWTGTACSGITPGSQAYALTTGPDGAIWFTEYTAPRIGRLDPATGVAVEYFGLKGPAVAIAPGPDGNVWFTENLGPANVPQIGRIAPDGTVTEFSAGLMAGQILGGLAPGSDGGVWFLKWGIGGTAVGRIDATSGQITFPASALFGTFPLFGGIAAGADGNVWFTDYYDAVLGRLAADGTLAEYGAVYPGSPVNAIAATRPGAATKAVWFTDPRTQRIGLALLP
jgi:streptogramin lyase